MEEFINQVRRAMPERYVVEREWGAGGAAIVYLAEDVKHGRKVAVKVLFEPNEASHRCARWSGSECRFYEWSRVLYEYSP